MIDIGDNDYVGVVELHSVNIIVGSGFRTIPIQLLSLLSRKKLPYLNLHQFSQYSYLPYKLIVIVSHFYIDQLFFFFFLLLIVS